MRADFLGHRVPDASRDPGQNISSESGQRSHHKLPFFRVHSEQTNQERLVQVITPGKTILIDRLLVNYSLCESTCLPGLDLLQQKCQS
jgi:hypothetical protein